MKPFLAAVRFLTVVPVPGTWGTAEADLARSVPFFPVIGLGLGCVAAGLAWILALIAPPMVAAVALVVAMMSFSGCLHLDGLSDTADGFLSSRTRERILEILKDSHVGAMGMIVVISVLLTKFAALASIKPSLLWAAALLMPLVGRCAMVVYMALLPYVRETGLGKVFYQRAIWPAALWAAALSAAVAWIVLRTAGVVIWGVSMTAALVLAVYCYRKIGGATGDTFGAVCEIVEVVPPLVLSVWPWDVAR